MAISTSTTLTELIPTIIASAKHTFQAGTVTLPLVHKINIAGRPGNTVQLPIMAAAGTAGEATEGSDYSTITTMDSGSGPSNVTVVFYKHIYQLTDLADLGSQENMAAMAGRMLGDAMAKAVEDAFIALYADFDSGNDVAGAGTSLTLAHFDSAMQYLKEDGAVPPYNGVLSVRQIWGAKGISAIFPVNANYRSFSPTVPGSPADDLARNAFATKILGFDIYANPGISTDGNDDDGGAFFSKEGLVLVEKTGVRVEEDRDASLTATEIVGSKACKAAIYRSTFGCYCLSDVS